MNCREFQSQIVLVQYEELQESDRTGLENHLLECENCRQASENLKEFHTLLADDTPAWDLPTDLLIDSRRELANELDRIYEKKRSWWRMPAFSVVLTPMRMLESAALVAMGLALGVYLNNHRAVPEESPAAFSEVAASSIPQNSRVSNVRIVSADSGSGVVEFAGDIVQPLRFQGRMDEDTTRRLLFSAVQDAMNPASRMQAVEVLAQKSAEPSARGILIHALLNDMSLGVRLKAFEGLRPFASEEDVRIAFIQALMKDPSDGVRVAAVDALAPFVRSPAFASQIEEVTRNDDNTYVRLKGQGLIQLVGTGK